MRNVNDFLYGLVFLLTVTSFSVSAELTGICGRPSRMMLFYDKTTFTLSPTAAVGSLIGTELTVNPSATLNVSTGRPPFYYVGTASASVVSGLTYHGAPIYQTNLSGIGLAVWGDTYTGGPVVLLSNSTSAGLHAGTLHFALIKTAANVSTGMVTTNWGNNESLQCVNTSGTTVKSPDHASNSIAFTNVTITTPACYVSNTLISVPLGDVKRTTFNGVGSTSPAQSFTVPLVCSRATKVSMTLSPGASGAYNASNGIINLDTPASGKKATGVGIQLLYSNAAKALNTAFSVGSATAAGTFNVPLSARYYQTATAVTAGQANGTATFTMTYN